MKYIVYILQDEVGKRYKGMTSDLPRRLTEHRSGKTQSTRHLTNPKVVYTEEYENLVDARKREVYFKTAAGRRSIKKILGD